LSEKEYEKMTRLIRNSAAKEAEAMTEEYFKMMDKMFRKTKPDGDQKTKYLGAFSPQQPNKKIKTPPPGAHFHRPGIR
jgi:hypothetical protein